MVLCQMCGAAAGETHPYDPSRKTWLHIGHIVDSGTRRSSSLKYKASVVVNGCFWRMHEGSPCFSMPGTRQEYWAPKLKRNRQRDAMNKEKLERLGWRVIVVRECELKPKLREERLSALYGEILEEY